jgi:hypothetical protein
MILSRVSTAAALYDQQLVQDKQTLHDLEDKKINTICHILCRLCGNVPGNVIAEFSVTRLKLLCFWIRLQEITSRNINRITATTLDDIILLKEQKKLKDGWASDHNELDYASMTLNVSLAPKAFKKIMTFLTRVRGKTGIPLAYVIGHQLRVSDDEDPTFREDNLQNTSIDQEMIASAPILINSAPFT